MAILKSTLALLTITVTALAAVDGPCSVNGASGVCLYTSDCSDGDGTSTAGFCPGDPADVKCCTKSSCGSGASFKCCVPSGGGGGGGGSGGGSSTNHDLSDHGAAFIAGFEGFRADFYRDAANVKTIGYGHACQPDSECDSINAPITEAEGQALLKSDAATFVSCINKDVDVALNQNQFDALVSFTYNLGCGNLEDIAAHLNRNDFSGATSAMKQYTHAGGQVLPGLVRRRQEEVDLFNS
ncbi:MAG: hypothetical protein Q9170_001622 [Blastenia crenularia]